MNGSRVRILARAGEATQSGYEIKRWSTLARFSGASYARSTPTKRLEAMD